MYIPMCIFIYIYRLRFTAPVCLCVLLVGNAFTWDPLVLERAALWC